MAEVELVFRRVNEAIHASAVAGDDGVFVCECSDARCRKPVRVDLHEYRQIRRNPRYFLVAPGHESEPVAGFSRIVRVEASYSVKEKLGYAGALAVAGASESR